MQRQPAFYGPIFALFGQILCFTRNYSTWYMLHLVFSTGLFNKKFTDLQEVRRAAYLTCPPFSSHRLCTLDTSVILHTGITKKASKSLPAVKRQLFLFEISSLLRFFEAFPHITDLNNTKGEACFCARVFCKLVCVYSTMRTQTCFPLNI